MATHCICVLLDFAGQSKNGDRISAFLQLVDVDFFLLAEQSQRCFPSLSLECFLLWLSFTRTWSSFPMTVNSRRWASALPDVSLCWSSRLDQRDCSSGCRWEEETPHLLSKGRRNGVCVYLCAGRWMFNRRKLSGKMKWEAIRVRSRELRLLCGARGCNQ